MSRTWVYLPRKLAIAHPHTTPSPPPNKLMMLASVRTPAPLAVTQSYKKIYEIDDSIAAVSAGSLADARNLIDMARVKAQVNMITYSEPISVSSLTKVISDRKHLVTQYAGVRPFGVGLIIAGVDNSGPRLFETEPSGTMIEWNAQAIGRGAEKTRKTLIAGWKENMDIKAGAQLLIKALKAGVKEAGIENIGAVYVTKGNIEKIALKESKKG